MALRDHLVNTVSYYRASQNAYGHGRVTLRELAPVGTPLEVFSVGSLDIEAVSGESAGQILKQYQVDKSKPSLELRVAVDPGLPIRSTLAEVANLIELGFTAGAYPEWELTALDGLQ